MDPYPMIYLDITISLVEPRISCTKVSSLTHEAIQSHYHITSLTRVGVGTNSKMGQPSATSSSWMISSCTPSYSSV